MHLGEPRVLVAALALAGVLAGPAQAAELDVQASVRAYDGITAVPDPDPEPDPDPDPDPEPEPVRSPKTVRLPGATLQGGTQLQPWVRMTVFSEWYRENYNPEPSDDGFVSLVTRLNVGADTRMRRATLGTQIRVDGQKIWFVDGQDCGSTGNCVSVEDDVRLERTTVRLDTKHASLFGGDYNVQNGRGLGLSVRKIDEIGVDTTIKGGRVDLRTRPVRATAFAGFANRQNSDFATRQLLPDPGYPAKSYTFQRDALEAGCDVSSALDPDIGNPFWAVCSDLVAGGRVEGTLPGRVDVGAHYAYVDFGDEVIARTDNVVVDEHLHQIGADMGRARIGGVWDTFIGASGIVRNPNLRDTAFETERYDGHGIYASNTFFLGTTTLLVEAKHYTDYLMALSQNALVQYTENPTLEREDQQVPGNLNATGGRVRIDHTWRELGLTVFANSLAYVFAENLGQVAWREDEGRMAMHNYAGVIYRRPDADLVVQASGGYRYERFLQTDRQGGTLRRRFPHAELYLSIPLAKRGGLTHALAIRGEGRWENIRFGASEDFFRGLFSLGYSLSPWFSITYLQGIDTELPVPEGEPSLTYERCSNAIGSTCRPHLWPGVQAQINVMSSSFVRIFAGRQVGGRVCVNGSCRALPDFEGARVELVMGF